MDKKTQNATPKQSPFKTVVSNLAFHKFDEEPILVALFKDTQTLGEDDETFTANVMVNMATGEEIYVQNAYSIEKAIKTAKREYPDGIADIVFHIEFLGKTMLKGKPFNQFKIGYCTYEEYDLSTK
jgi:hypothetical protein